MLIETPVDYNSRPRFMFSGNKFLRYELSIFMPQLQVIYKENYP